MPKKETHAQHIAKQCVKNVVNRWGGLGARERLGNDFFQALVAREVVSVAMMQHMDKGTTIEHKASVAEYIMEVAQEAMKLAGPREDS